jgi:DNA invertase Pin-like site-specific DNA recombinase
LIRERVIAGLDRAKANNVKLGRPRKGFDVSEDLKLRNDGKGYKQISDILNIPRTTLFRVLQDIPKTPVQNA